MDVAQVVAETGTRKQRMRIWPRGSGGVRKCRMLARCALAALAGAAALGCGTVNSYASGCPAIYSGIRTDAAYLRELGSFRQDSFDWITIVGDLPLSLLGDTILAPASPLLEAEPASPPGLGCEWSRERP